MLLLLLDLIDEEDQDKFKTVYKEYANLVRYISLKKLGNQELADECAQEAWISIAKNFKKIGDPYDPRTKGYVSIIATNWANKVYNKESRFKTVEFNDDILTDISDAEFFNKIRISEISEIFKKLPERQKSYIFLSYSYGYTSKEIGKMYGVSDASVRKAIQFAKARIRQELEEKEGEHE